MTIGSMRKRSCSSGGPNGAAVAEGWARSTTPWADSSAAVAEGLRREERLKRDLLHPPIGVRHRDLPWQRPVDAHPPPVGLLDEQGRVCVVLLARATGGGGFASGHGAPRGSGEQHALDQHCPP